MEKVKNHASDEYLLLKREKQKQRNLPKRVSCRSSSASRFVRFKLCGWCVLRLFFYVVKIFVFFREKIFSTHHSLRTTKDLTHMQKIRERSRVVFNASRFIVCLLMCLFVRSSRIDELQCRAQLSVLVSPTFW